MPFNLNVKPADRHILERRTRVLSQEAGLTQQLEQVSDAQELECLLFVSGGVRYGIEKDYVQELHRGVTPLEVPCTPDFVRGIVNIRGGILSVNDLGLFMGQPALDTLKGYPMFQLQDQNMLIGVLTERIENIVSFSAEQIKPYEQPGKKTLQKYLLGVTLDMTYILDAQTLLNDQRLVVKA